MSYCELHDKYNCDEPHGALRWEGCEWCGEEGVFSEGLCKRCYFSETPRYEEVVSSTKHCKNCGRNYPRAGFHRC